MPRFSSRSRNITRNAPGVSGPSSTRSPELNEKPVRLRGGGEGFRVAMHVAGDLQGRRADVPQPRREEVQSSSITP